MKANLKPPYFGYRGAYKGMETAAEKRNFFPKGRICRFTSTDDYNNIVSITKSKTSSDTVLLYHRNPSSLKASIDGNLGEIFTEFGYYASSWVKNNYLKLESPAKDGRVDGAHTYTAGAAQMLTDINTIINGGKIDKYYVDENGYYIGVTKGGLEIPVDRVGNGVKLMTKSEAGFDDKGNYNGGNDDDEKSTKKYIIIGLAVVAVIVTFIILKKKKIINL